jgi:hypothetical protein
MKGETAMKSPGKRPYQRHGLTTLQAALKSASSESDWIDRLGTVGAELRQWRAGLIADLGGDSEISAMERSIVDLATQTYVMLSSVDRFLIEQPSLVNKSRRSLFPVVQQRQALADALARYMGQLGLKKRTRPAHSLAALLAGSSTTQQPEQEVPHEPIADIPS